MTPVLDRIMQLQSQGLQEQEIIQTLQNEGTSPKEIEESLNQAKIKTAVSQQEPTQQQAMPSPEQMQQPPQTQEMQQSIMNSNQEAPQQMQEQAMPSPEQMQQTQPTETYQDYYAQTPQAYSDQAYYPQQGISDTETITEIAEQIVLEKIQEQNKKTGDIASFKTQTTEKLKDLDERLKKIEDSIEQLQQAVIQKIGEFGETTEFIHKDLENMHDTMSKLMNPLVDNYKELKKIAGKK